MIDSENIADPKAGRILREDLRYGIVISIDRRLGVWSWWEEVLIFYLSSSSFGSMK